MAPRRRARASVSSAPPSASLHYKVVELSTVDESSLEHAVNAAVREGWRLDGVQFAMRESSKRPSMAFVFFTRPGLAPDDESVLLGSMREQGARSRLLELAGGDDASEEDDRS